MESSGGELRFCGELTLDTIAPVEAEARELLIANPRSELQADLSQVTRLDTAGAVFLRRLPELGRQFGKEVSLTSLPQELRPFFDFLGAPPRRDTTRQPTTGGRLEALGSWMHFTYGRMGDFLFLAADLTWAAGASLFRRGGIRRGSFVDQAVAIGSQGLPIIALILFLIGAVSALQAAAQLRKFGANIYVADLLAIGICRELGPLMTAIVVSGRSGSAIAAEVATMKFTEELDALRTMALDPLRFVAVPKLWAMMLCVPLLTIMADFMGIVGGILVGITYLEVAPVAFVSQVLDALVIKDIVTGLAKSLSFAWIVTLIAVHRGLGFSGGAAGVGQATTSSVVTSIFGIVILDSFWGLVFYMG